MDQTSTGLKNSKVAQSPDNPSELRTNLIRPCETYKDEYDECLSSKGRRQQIFVHGEVLDCEQWSKDFKNCQKWTWKSDEDAAKSIIESEMRRLDDRLKPHLFNQVWKKRDKPPEDWNKPLPEFMELNKNSYLNLINEKGEESVQLRNQCSIQ
ncbi:UPF0545 protein C22orf39 homolog [Thrips palmi]|uniref:Synaptic plasticity regulator PANTS n=1 Tax=Thrips palmi TaxID=161013 RepID=A0A6P8YVX3_THRPL|nr:UPF0545 protein C22orf39 homolog [Thrips palmi]XP_034241351.1 UPF0545 protein C22orf39 homolog [Thrips palmi]XP_034241352.1 UPF0545 protein C22orf39 homolog [Thrips palmi]